MPKECSSNMLFEVRVAMESIHVNKKGKMSVYICYSILYSFCYFVYRSLYGSSSEDKKINRDYSMSLEH
ncbi:unnamed protein product [marine sediment metagenome]|uniref:Uncharacterized protein n=1 Tax=marine sediment metagenome TaxID=412755 RepID=X0UNN4_9ZZZZ